MLFRSGSAMVDIELQSAVLRDIALLSSVGVQIVVVHGGGPEINQWLKKLGIKPVFLDGLRITDTETMDVVEIEVFGKTANELGTYTVAARDGKQVDIGSYVVIWKKTNDGWKLHWDIFNSQFNR